MGVVIETDRWSLGSVLPSAAGPAPPPAVLEVSGLTAGYGPRTILRGVDLRVGAGEALVVLGANGAGRTTLIRALSGELPLTAGTVSLRQRPAPDTAEARAAAGFATTTEVLPSLTVKDHLRMSGCDLAASFERYPELAVHRRRRAGELPVGHQRLLSVAVALGRNPQVLLVDELSRSTRPADVDRCFLAIREAADEGLAVVLTEQFVRRSFLVADHVVVLRRGEVAFAGTADEAHKRIAEIEADYLFG